MKDKKWKKEEEMGKSDGESGSTEDHSVLPSHPQAGGDVVWPPKKYLRRLLHQGGCVTVVTVMVVRQSRADNQSLGSPSVDITSPQWCELFTRLALWPAVEGRYNLAGAKAFYHPPFLCFLSLFPF